MKKGEKGMEYIGTYEGTKVYFTTWEEYCKGVDKKNIYVLLDKSNMMIYEGMHFANLKLDNGVYRVDLLKRKKRITIPEKEQKNEMKMEFEMKNELKSEIDFKKYSKVVDEFFENMKNNEI